MSHRFTIFPVQLVVRYNRNLGVLVACKIISQLSSCRVVIPIFKVNSRAMSSRILTQSTIVKRLFNDHNLGYFTNLQDFIEQLCCSLLIRIVSWKSCNAQTKINIFKMTIIFQNQIRICEINARFLICHLCGHVFNVRYRTHECNIRYVITMII